MPHARIIRSSYGSACQSTPSCIAVAQSIPDVAGFADLLFDRSLGRKVTASQADLRRVVCAAAELGIPIPAFMVSLAYFDGYRSDWRPANPSAT